MPNLFTFTFKKEMEATRFIIITAFTILASCYLLQFLLSQGYRERIWGVPAIVKIHFYSGKFALFTPWLFFIAKALKPGIGYIHPPESIIWISLVLLCLGCAIMISGMLAHRNAIHIGLSGKNNILVTGGIYKITRNPMYLGAYLMAAGSCLYYPDLINITLSVYGMVIHHLIILKEEAHLRSQFGKEYESYLQKVRRYI